MITISKEDYLKAIAEAEAEGQTVIPATLAHWLSVTRPAVTFALKRLTKDGLVSVKGDGHIRLTSQGREIARGLVNYSSVETRRILKAPSREIEARLGYVDEPELIHRDNLVLL